MAFKLPELPYSRDALEPYISQETLEYHYDKHHAGYVKKLNNGIEGSGFEGKSLEDIIINADPGGLYNNAAQVWNHAFYWHCMTADQSDPEGELAQAIDKSFGSFEKFKDKFSEVAAGQFGSGWGWLVQDDSGSLKVISTKDADNPITDNMTPLLTCDVWEHAYYIDYRNDRAKYIDNFWSVVNWDFVKKNFVSGADYFKVAS